MFSKKRVVEGDPKKIWSGTATEREVEYEEVGLEISLMGIYRGDFTFSPIERNRPLCSLHSSKDQEKGAPNGQVISIKGAANGIR